MLSREPRRNKKGCYARYFPNFFPFTYPHLLELWKDSHPVIQIFHKKDHEEINRTKFICNYNSIYQNQNTILWSFKLPLLPVLQDASHLKLTSQVELVFPQSSQVNSRKIKRSLFLITCASSDRISAPPLLEANSERHFWKQDTPVLFLWKTERDVSLLLCKVMAGVTAKSHSSCKPVTSV